MYSEERAPTTKDLVAPAIEVQPDEAHNFNASDGIDVVDAVGRRGCDYTDATAATTRNPAAVAAASASASSVQPLSADILEIQELLWGATINADIFDRWSQGFEFSESEPSALVQHQGGPCAVIAPVQAYLLHILLSEGVQTTAAQLADLTTAKCQRLLVQAVCTILAKCQATSSASSTRFRIFALKPVPTSEQLQQQAQLQEQPAQPMPDICTAGATATAPPTESPPGMDDIREDDGAAAATAAADDDVMLNTTPDNIAAPPSMPLPVVADIQPTPESIDESMAAALADFCEPDANDFHRRLCIIELATIDEVHEHYVRHFGSLQQRYGILLFMYSVLLTKRLTAIEPELHDSSEPLIHEVYGYASQGLINLMLTGRAVANVWDNEQDVGGLKLKGLDSQSDVGFITLMETLRYCTVGSFYKNPKSPVWVLASETHLTVLFSDERRLVSPETPGEIGRRVFKSYDPDGNNFIPTGSLQDVLAALELVSETEYVELMQKRLDPEGLGIILMNSFMDEFFSDSDRPSLPDSFELLHYNGIPGSNDNQQVKYNRGYAVLLESDLKAMVRPGDQMLTCLQTKWPTIELTWQLAHGKQSPSLN